MNSLSSNAYLPHEAIILERIEETPDLFTLRLKFSDDKIQAAYEFAPGQFNMLYLYGVGEIPISIVNNPSDSHILDHTIRIVGRVTQGFAQLKAGDRIGVRGPYGRGWPIQASLKKDIVIITGGLGCAPVVSAINYIEHHRSEYGYLNIVQGVKHSHDFIWKERYDRWRELPDSRVLLAADAGDSLWPFHIGLVTELFEQLQYDPQNTVVMMCGPEGLMRVSANYMLNQQVEASQLFLSMERNMQCAVGHCGHCQFGEQFVCKDGPVFRYDKIKPLFETRGF